MTDICWDIISCIREAGRGYGAGTIAGALHGSKSEKIRNYGLDQMKIYGCRANVNEFRLKEIIGELTAREILRTSDDKYALLSLGEGAEEIEQGIVRVIMKFSRGPENKVSEPKNKKQAGRDMSSESWQLFEKLRELRLQIAKEEKVPPYIVFTDKTLVDMCVKKPRNRAEMLEVSGVGEAKYKKYGERFLKCLKI